MTANQFSLRAAFIATALVAVAAWAAKYGVTGPDVLCLLAVPVLIAAAVGTLAGRVGLWLKVGFAIDVAFLGLAFVPMIEPIGLILLAAVVLTAARRSKPAGPPPHGSRRNGK